MCRLLSLCLLLYGQTLLGPTYVSAHGLSGRSDLPVPEWLFAWAASLVLVLSFVCLAILWRKPKLDSIRLKRCFRVPVFVDLICGLIGTFLFGFFIYAGLAGSQVPVENILPTFIYVIFWVGLVIISGLFGNVFRLFNPWLALARGGSHIYQRLLGERPPKPFAYPSWLGYWPAVLGVAVFGWFELVYPGRQDPSTLALLALIYCITQLLMISIYGIESWSKYGDPFAVYFRLFSRLSIFTVRERVLYLRKPLSGLVNIEQRAGLPTLAAVIIGISIFDGAAEGPLWVSVAPKLQHFFMHLQISPNAALEVANTVGLLLAVGTVYLVYLLGIYGIRGVVAGQKSSQLSLSFAHSLVPIGFVYIIAHYFSFFVYQGQAMIYLCSDPLGRGWNLFSSTTYQINYSLLSATSIWYVQVGVLVFGHVLGIILAHDRALATCPDSRTAARSQYYLLGVMVTFTSLGLWLLASANQ